MRRPALSLLLWVHRWSGLASAAFALVVCLTGLPLIFAPEIDAALNPPAPAAVASVATTWQARADLARRIDRAAAVRYVGQSAPGRAFVTLRAGDGRWSRVGFDTHTGRVVMDKPLAGGLTMWLLAIHARLLGGAAGQLVLAAAAAVLCLALISGLLVHAPFMPRAGPLAARGDGSPRVRWLDRHNLVGLILAAWMLVLTLTGGLLALAGPIDGHWRASALATLRTTTPDGSDALPSVSIDAAVAAARSRYPASRLDFVALPGTGYATARGYVVYLADGPAVLRIARHAVWVDAHDPRTTRDLPLGFFMAALMSVRSLHFGDFGGIFLRAIWALLDVAMLGVITTGLWLWWQRVSRVRPARVAGRLTA